MCAISEGFCPNGCGRLAANGFCVTEGVWWSVNGSEVHADYPMRWLGVDY